MRGSQQKGIIKLEIKLDTTQVPSPPVISGPQGQDVGRRLHRQLDQDRPPAAALAARGSTVRRAFAANPRQRDRLICSGRAALLRGKVPLNVLGLW